MPRTATAITILLLASSCACVRLAGEDVKAVATAPLHADATEWRRAGLAAAAVAATTLADDQLRTTAQHNQSHAANGILKPIETLGGGNSTKVMAAFLGYGVIRQDPRATGTAFDAFVSSVIASQAITPALKRLASRRRPNGGTLSFPSNHSTEAWALASSITAHYRQPWVQAVAYGLATGVGAARVYHGAHWASDVVAGAIIGSAVARTVAHTNDRLRIVPVRGGVTVILALPGRPRSRVSSDMSFRRP